MSQSQGNDPALPAATGSDGTGGAAATTDTGAPTAEERDEILKAMMQTGEGGDTSGGGGAPEAGETLVGGGSAVDINEAIFGANSLMARRKAMLEAHKKGLPVVPVSAQVQKHKFWDTQPVKKLHEDEVDEECGPIDEIKTPDQVRQTPYALPKGFEWVSMDVTDETQIAEIYKLLTENYVQDDDAMFRFDYSIPFLQWALTPPGYFKEWHVGVRQCSNGRLRGFISGIPAEVQVYDAHMKMSEINFLCVHQKLRSKRLAPVLIKEVTRRVNLLDQWQAVYTAGVVLPKPVGQCHYYHRSINPKKLIEIGFSRLGERYFACMRMLLCVWLSPFACNFEILSRSLCALRIVCLRPAHDDEPPAETVQASKQTTNPRVPPNVAQGCPAGACDAHEEACDV